MTREDIIRMAMDAGLYSGNPRTPGTENMIVRRLERFAALVAAAEREACARACEEMQIVGSGEHGFLERSTIKDCVETLRARGGA